VPVKKLIIETTLDGRVPKSTNKNIPYSPEEIAPAAVASVKAGSSLLHFNARDPKTGSQRWTDSKTYKQAVQLMRKQGVSRDTPWYPSYEGITVLGNAIRGIKADRMAVTNERKRLEDSFVHIAVLAQDPEIGLEITPVDVGTENFNEYNPNTRKFLEPDEVKTLTHDGIKYVFDLCKQLHQRPYLSIFTAGHLRHVGTYLDMGWIEPPILMKFHFSDYAPYGLPPMPRSVEMYAEMIETVMPGVLVEWFVACHGHSIWNLVKPAISLGGHVTVGIGQYHPWSWPDPTREEPTSAEQVQRVAELAKSMARQIASPADARAIFALNGP
jgi:uncharacterized protein (DUF849 family)